MLTIIPAVPHPHETTSVKGAIKSFRIHYNIRDHCQAAATPKSNNSSKLTTCVLGSYLYTTRAGPVGDTLNALMVWLTIGAATKLIDRLVDK